MHEISIILQLLAPAITCGIFYGATNARIKALEKSSDAKDSLGERLAKVEAKLDLLIKNYK